jgi:hypothetical protein
MKTLRRWVSNVLRLKNSAAAISPAASTLADAAVHGYTTAFWWAARIFAVGTIACGPLLGRPTGVTLAEPLPQS